CRAVTRTAGAHGAAKGPTLGNVRRQELFDARRRAGNDVVPVPGREGPIVRRSRALTNDRGRGVRQHGAGRDDRLIEKSLGEGGCWRRRGTGGRGDGERR